MEMLLVKDIDVCHVPEMDTLWLNLARRPDYVPVDGGKSAMTFQAYKEHVRGREFVNRRGERVCIGMTKKVGDILGLEYEYWERMDRNLGELRDRLSWLDDYLQTASLWTRLKWLFCGAKLPVPSDEAGHPDPEDA